MWGLAVSVIAALLGRSLPDAFAGTAVAALFLGATYLLALRADQSAAASGLSLGGLFERGALDPRRLTRRALRAAFSGTLSLAITRKSLELEAIDDAGLDELDRTFLRTLIEVYGGGPVGIDAVAATLSEERETLEDVIEPYLLQQGFLTRTRQGRRATPKAYDHLKIKWTPPPATASGNGEGPGMFGE